MGEEIRRSPHVLLVDDEEVFRDTLVKVLAARGLVARTAASGQEAIAALDSQAPDVVVLDLKMPGMGGLEVLQRIAAQRPHLPVIILTGHGTVEAGLEAVRDLAFDFLLKPVPVDRLVGVILAAAETGIGRP